MRLRAEVHCYHCGEVSGTWEWPVGTSPERGLFREFGDGGRALSGTFRQLRCGRCGGPVFLDEIEPVVVRPTVSVEPPRRGRPPKQPQPLAS